MDDFIEGLTYARKEPNVTELHTAYRRDVDSNSSFWDVASDAYDQTRSQWPGKTRDQLKRQVDAKPWQFASDAEVPVIEPRRDSLVALMMNAVRSGHIAAYPVGDNDPETAASTSTFMRWMFDSWIPDFYEEIELAAYNFVEKGIAVGLVGWEKQNRAHLEKFEIDEIAIEGEEGAVFAEILMDETREEEIIAALQSQFEAVDERKAKKALKELRETGVAEIPVVKQDIDRPVIMAKDPGSDCILPSYAMSAKRISRMHFRNFLTAQDMIAAAEANGWDREWVDDIIDNHMGVTQSDIDGEYGNASGFSNQRQAHSFDTASKDAPDLAEIVESYVKLVDEDTGAVGIYQIVWCPKQTSKSRKGDLVYGKYELFNGWDEFPVAFVPYARDTKRIYDVRGLAERLRGNQRMSKVTRDSTIDQFSLAVNPPRTHPAGRPPSVWGAGADFATRRGEENLYRTLEIPNTRREGVDLERYLNEEADMISGLTEDSSVAIQRQQQLINRFLMFVGECGRLSYKAYQKLYGKDEIHFRITGSPDQQTYNRNPMQEDLDIRISYDTRLNDPDFVQKTTETLAIMRAANTDGNYSNREIDAVWAQLAIPQFASRILRAPDEARAEVLENVSNDLAKIWSLQEVGARSEGAQMALQYIGEVYMKKPGVQQRLQTDPEFAEALQKYIEQYEFQIQQNQNAQTGRIGTEAAELQGTNNG